MSQGQKPNKKPAPRTNGQAPTKNQKKDGASRKTKYSKMGGRPGLNPGGLQKDLVQTLVEENEFPAEVEQILRGDLDRGHSLANFEEKHADYRWHKMKNRIEFILAVYPPKSSVWTGKTRQLHPYLNDERTPLTPEQETALRNALESARDRTTRSRGGWLMELLTKVQQERRVVEDHTGDENGFFARLLGGK